MPLTVFGTFEVRASRDLGSLGPKEGKPVKLSFPVYRHLTRVVPWLIFLPLFLLKGNRTPRALPVLLPLLVVQGLLAGVGAVFTSFAGSEASFLAVALSSLNLGLAACWLLLHRIGGHNRAITFLLALLILAVFGIASLVSHGALDYMLMPHAVVYGFYMSALLLTMLFAAVFSRKRYRAGRFIWHTALAGLGVCALQILPFFVFGLIVAGVMGGDELLEMLWAFLLFACISTALVFGFHLPYLLLGFRSAFYRERFFAALRLPGMVPARPEPAPADTETPA